MLVVVAVVAGAAREQAALAEAAQCVLAERASTGAVQLQAIAPRMPDLLRAFRIQSRAGLTSAALADSTLGGPAGPTLVCLADQATGRAGTEVGPEEAGAEIIGRDTVGVGVQRL